MERETLLDEPPELAVPSMVIAMLCRARDFTSNLDDRECYEQAIECTLRVKALKDQREKALKALAEMGEEFDARTE